MPHLSVQPITSTEHRYIRVCLGGESGEPGMTLYEVDDEGWVYRQVQLHAAGTRFSPEDILMCQPVITDAMLNHPASDEVSAEEFERMWVELADGRPFSCRIPDVNTPWAGRVEFGGRVHELAWVPSGDIGGDWSKVPGFSRLFARGDARNARAACAAVFVDREIEWYVVRKAA